MQRPEKQAMFVTGVQSQKSMMYRKSPNFTKYHKTFQGQQNFTRMQNEGNMMPTCPQL